MKPGLGWPIAIVSLLGMNMSIVAITTYFATNSKTSTVVPDYYTKAVHWDDTAKQVATNRTLGWIVAINVQPRSSGLSGQLVVRLTDASGTSIRAAIVHAEAFHESDSTKRLSGVLSMTSDGVYAGSFPIERAGRWRVHVVVDAVGMRFTAEESVESDSVSVNPVGLRKEPS